MFVYVIFAFVLVLVSSLLLFPLLFCATDGSSEGKKKKADL